MKTIALIITFLSLASFGQLKVTKINQTDLTFSIENLNIENLSLTFGKTKQLELGTVQGNMLINLAPATFYYVVASIDGLQITEPKLYTTASKSSGDITVYFNQTVNNDVSNIADAIQVTSFEDTIIAYINSAQYTLDICNYNTGSLPIVNAINTAKNNGIVVRYISADNTGTNNSELSNLLNTIPQIQRPNDGEVMHNKFLIIDAGNSNLSTVLTGSVNHTENSCDDDFNNMVILEDQAIALAYKTEFEEMWGSSASTPNIANAKFGEDKVDNTPHTFNIGGKAVELYFSPSDGTTAKIETAVLSANTNMEIAMFTFLNNDLGDAVENRQNAGVNTKCIIENRYYFGSEYNKLENAGVSILSHFSTANAFHHKYAIVDAKNIASDPLVITGSHNWTNSAENDYDENTLIIHDAEIANMYYEEFIMRYGEMTGTTEIVDKKIDLNIYPNPTAKSSVIESSEIIFSIKVFDLKGRLLFNCFEINKTNYTLELSGLTQGIYILEIETSKHNLMKKVVKS